MGNSGKICKILGNSRKKQDNLGNSEAPHCDYNKHPAWGKGKPRKSQEFWEKTGNPWEIPGKILGKSWENLWKFWENSRKKREILGKSWEIWENLGKFWEI